MTRTVLITGCSSGIGKALAEAFSAIGDTVIATARRPQTLADLQDRCLCVALDVNSADSRAALLEQLASAGHGHLDMLINNAGISAMGPLLELPAEKLRGQFETNVVAPVLLTQALFPLLQQGHQPKVVNIGSVAGVMTTPFAGAYCASKAAVHSISEALRMELAPFGVDVITVQPGGIKSKFGDSAAEGINAWLTDASRYAPIRDGIMTRAGMSQVHATSAEDFAASFIAGLSNDKPKSVQRIGNGSTLLPLLRHCLPERLRHRLLSRKFGLGGFRA